jgi:hypothetical protein
MTTAAAFTMMFDGKALSASDLAQILNRPLDSPLYRMIKRAKAKGLIELSKSKGKTFIPKVSKWGKQRRKVHGFYLSTWKGSLYVLTHQWLEFLDQAESIDDLFRKLAGSQDFRWVIKTMKEGAS